MLHIFLISLLVVAGFPADVMAQSWDINKPVDLNDGIAEVLGIEPSLQLVNLQFFSAPQAGEFTQISCYFDEQASFSKNGTSAGFADLKVGDRVLITSSLFAKANRSCRQLIFVDDGYRPVVEPTSIPKFGSTLAQVVSINAGLKSLSLKFNPKKDRDETKVYTCFFDKNSYLEKDGRQAKWDELKTGEWVATDMSQLNSSQRYCGPLKVVGRSQKIDQEQSNQDFGDGKAQVLSRSLFHQNVSLKVYVKGYTGEYAIVSCYFDDKSYLEKDGKPARLRDLKESDWVQFNQNIGESAQRSCGGLKVIPRP